MRTKEKHEALRRANLARMLPLPTGKWWNRDSAKPAFETGKGAQREMGPALLPTPLSPAVGIRRYAYRLASRVRLPKQLAAYVARRSRRCRMGPVIRGVRRQLQLALPFRGRIVAPWRLERLSEVLRLLPISTPGRIRSGLSGDGALRGISGPVSGALLRDCLAPFLLRAGFRLRVDLVRCLPSGSAGDPSGRSVSVIDG